MINRRQFLKLLTTAPAIPFCWRHRNGELSIDELEVLAEERGGKWIDIYLRRIR